MSLMVMLTNTMREELCQSCATDSKIATMCMCLHATKGHLFDENMKIYIHTYDMRRVYT
jgi:hypothetical protein